LRKLRPISPNSSPQPMAPSTEQASVVKLRRVRLRDISASKRPTHLSTLSRLPAPTERRILDFDIETLAAGYADPQWVPDKITCISASWIGDDRVYTWVTGQLAYWSREGRARTVLAPFFDLLRQADVVTGHNIQRFDLRVLNAECMRCGIEPIRAVRVEDTMRILRTKGFKKGLDNIAAELGITLEKKALNWAQWDLAYEDPSWREIIERCETDVRLHKLVRAEMKQRGWLRPETEWKA